MTKELYQTDCKSQDKSENNSGLCLDLTTRLYEDRGRPEGFPLSSVKVISFLDTPLEGNPVYQDAPGHDDSYQIDQLDLSVFHRHTPEEIRHIINQIDLQDTQGRRAYWNRIESKQNCIADYIRRSRLEFKELLNAWTYFLTGFEWSWYCHFTFRFSTHPESAIKTFRKWCHQLNRSVYGTHYWKHKEKGIIWVLAIEYQKRDTIHFHNLSYDPGLLMDWKPESGNKQRLYWMEKWNELAGFSRIKPYIEPFDIRKSAERYMTKYLCKGGDILLSDTMKLIA